MVTEFFRSSHNYEHKRIQSALTKYNSIRSLSQGMLSLTKKKLFKSEKSENLFGF